MMDLMKYIIALSYFQATVSTNTAHLQYKDMTPQYWG